jgi:serine/threonine-protein kinase RsbW
MFKKRKTRTEFTGLPTVNGLEITIEGKLGCNGNAVFYDVIKLDDDETALLLLVTKGSAIPAAYATATAKLSFRHALKAEASTSNVLLCVNNELIELVGSDIYYKAFIGIIDQRTNTFRFSNAGIPNTNLITANSTKNLSTLGGHLSLFTNWSYEEKKLSLEVGDVIILSLDDTLRIICKIVSAPRKTGYLIEANLEDSELLRIKTIHDFDQMKLLIRDLMNEADMVGYPIKFQKSFRLVLLELLTNSIIHGNKYDSLKKVIVLYEINQKFIQIAVIDEGEGYNPSSLANPLAPENMNKPHGRGIFLIKHYAEHFALLGRGNITTVRFTRAKAQ